MHVFTHTIEYEPIDRGNGPMTLNDLIRDCEILNIKGDTSAEILSIAYDFP